jgi:hypothetical protein
VSDIFQEVEEDVRRERYEQIWKKYGNYIIAVAAVIVAVVAGYQAWQRYDLTQRQQVSDRLRDATQVAQTGNLPKAETDFAALTKDAPSGYATLAKFQLAGTYLAQGKRDQGVALLRELTASSDPIISSTARLRLAWALADASPKPEIVTLLQPLMEADNPWRFAAGEVLAYVDLKGGARSEAMAEYQKLSQDAAAPANLRQRAAGISEFLRANPPSGAPSASPPLTPNVGAPQAQGTKPK